MNNVPAELHHYDATFDIVDPEHFEVYFTSLDNTAKQALVAQLTKRYHSYAKQTIRHHDQGVLGIAADQYSINDATRRRRERAEVILDGRQDTLQAIQGILSVALRGIAVDSQN